MELLIPGLILVALMVWASTRIKRNAAAAFEAERVDAPEFAINKPEGFLHVLNDDSGLAFRSYSKEFGKVGNKDVRAATIEIEKHDRSDIDSVRQNIEADAESIGSFEAYIDGGEKAARGRSVSIQNGGEYEVSHKLVARGSTVWECRGSVLSERSGDFSVRIEEALDSVRIK